MFWENRMIFWMIMNKLDGIMIGGRRVFRLRGVDREEWVKDFELE